MSSLVFEGHSYQVMTEPIYGAVDGTKLTFEGISVSAWAVADAGQGKFEAPTGFLVTFGREARLMVRPNRLRRDIANKFGDEVVNSGGQLDIPLALLPLPYNTNFDVYAVFGTRCAKVAFFAPNHTLGPLNINSAHDFVRQIQTPSTRLADRDVLFFASVHALTRFRTDFHICSGALCVIGYRLLENWSAYGSFYPEFLRESERVLTSNPPVQRGLYFRWHTSVRLVCGYLAYQHDDRPAALQQFEEIGKFQEELPFWPQALTNVLLSIFLQGLIHFENGEKGTAAECWKKAEDVLRRGAGLSVFQNLYAYGELGNAVRVAEECHAGRLIAAAGGPLNDPTIGPVGRHLNFRALGPIAKLAEERSRRVERAAASAAT